MNDTFSSPTGIAWEGFGQVKTGLVQYGDDSKMVVAFYWRSVENKQRSIQANTPIFENVAYVRMHPPGERLNVVDRPATEEDKHRFPRYWNQFVRKQAQIPEGTPLEILYPNNPAYADMLKAHGIFTIQQLAKLSGQAIDSVGMGAQEAVNKANTYLKESGDTKATQVLHVELEKKDREIKVLRQQIEQQKKQIDELFRRMNSSLAPRAAELNPAFNPLHDPQTERINSTHPTQELKGKHKVSKKKEAPPRDELDALSQAKLAIEEVEEPYDD